MRPEERVARSKQRLLARAEKLGEAEGGCWTWLGAKQLGFGRFYFDGKKQFAHRVSYQLFKGPIPDGLEIDHLCFRRSCINPDHLEAVTPVENTRRSRAYRGDRPD